MFQNKANQTICISTWGSDLSNEKFLNYCDQSYLIKSQYVKVPVLSKHSLAHNIYRQILSKNTLYNNIISFNNPPNHTKQDAEVEDDRIIKVDGFLNAENLISKKLNYLEMKRNNTNIFIGSSIDNEFICEENVCEFYGWKGNDIFVQNENDITIKDFREERVNEKTKKREQDADKLVLKNGDYRPIKKGEDILLFVKYKKMYLLSKTTTVTLEGVSEGEVKKWIDVALGRGKYLDWNEEALRKEQEKNPIQIE